MKLTLYFFGKKYKKGWLAESHDFYLSKIKHHAAVELIFVDESKCDQWLAGFNKQSGTRCLICCDERGKSMGTLEFSKFISDKLDLNQEIAFVIGGAYGIPQNIREQSHLLLSLSAFVLNHQVAQVLLLEQTYRALTIRAGLPYHHI